VAALYALRAVREAGVELRHGVRLILGCAEEIGMDDMRHYATAVPPPDYGFSPDAGFPLINIEKGGLNLELTYEGSESEARIPIFNMYAGERPNVVPDIARAEVGTGAVTIDELRTALTGLQAEITVSATEEGRAVIEARGSAAHGAMPASGVNAAGALLIALAHVNAGGEGINKVIKTFAEKIGMENDGKSLNIACSETLSGALTCNLGILRYDGRSVRAELDIRYPIGADEDDIRASVQNSLSEAGVAVTRLQGRPVHHIPENHRLVRELLSVYNELTGFEAYTIAIGGGTYARMIPNAVAFGCAFPDDADCAHMPDESVDIEKLLLCCRIMAHAIMRLAG
jgi:succinyl-diaminopimelate desuccinylase